jgi:hypothetical protein
LKEINTVRLQIAYNRHYQSELVGVKNTVYLTIKETADYLSISVQHVENLIRVLYDSNGAVLVYQEQFNTHFEQIKKYKMLVEELANEPIPEDKDIKDED